MSALGELRRLYGRQNWGIEMIEPDKDKVSRAHACVPLFVDGAIWLQIPSGPKW